MKCKFSIAAIIIGLFLAFTSCDKDNDLILDNTSQPTSKITSDLIVSSLKASAFIEESTQQERLIYIDTTSLDLVNSDLLMEELIKSKLSFQFKNSLNRDFRVDFEFLNNRDELKFELQIPISAATIEKPTVVETSVIIESSELTSFKKATKLVYKITLLPSDESLSRESEGSLDLQSNASYFFDI